MAKPKKRVKKQKLSPTAAKAKAARDKKRAMRGDRKAKKAENQRKRRTATKKGRKIKGKDYDHKKKNDEIINILNIYAFSVTFYGLFNEKRRI